MSFQQQSQRGFTLIEVMITVAIIGIIAAIAIPLYNDYVATANDGALVEKTKQMRLFQDDYRVENGTYLPGTYLPGVSNDFEDEGFRVTNDNSDIGLRVEPGPCGNISNCYRVIAQHPSSARRFVWDFGAERFEN